MAFVGVEFSGDEGLAIVSSKWLTPRKRQVFWPPFRQRDQYEKAVKKGYEPDENTWKIFNITKCYFYTGKYQDDFKDAQTKLKIAESTSDIPDVIVEHDETSNVKRKRFVPSRLYFSQSQQEDYGYDVDDSEEEPLVNKRKTNSASQPTKSNCEVPRRSNLVHSLEDSDDEVPINKTNKICARPPRINCENFIPGSSTAQLTPLHCDNPQQSRAESSLSSIAGSSSNIFRSLHNTLDRVTSTPNRHSLNERFNTQISQNLDEDDDQDLTGKPMGQQIATYLSRIFTQNRQILNILTSIKKQNQMSTSSATLPENLPVKFPLETDDDVKLLEIHLKDKDNLTALSLYLSTLGGRSTANQINTILKFLITDNLAAKFSFKGTRNNKKPFVDLGLKTVIVRAVRGASAEITERAVEDLIKVWLKHAPERIAKKQKKNA